MEDGKAGEKGKGKTRNMKEQGLDNDIEHLVDNNGRGKMSETVRGKEYKITERR